MASRMNKPVAGGMDDYQAMDDARTLGDAHQMRKGTHPTFSKEKEIKGDKKRHSAAKAYAKKEYAKRSAETNAMAVVAGGGEPDGDESAQG